jgi:hypothetical protein
MNFFGYSVEIKKRKKDTAENIFDEIEEYFEDNYENDWLYYHTTKKKYEEIKRLAEMDYNYYRDKEDDKINNEMKSYYDFVVSEENRFTNKIHFKVKLKGNSGC